MSKFLTFTLLFTSLVSFAQTKQKSDKDKERIDSVCDQFMQTFANGKISESLEFLKQNTVMAPSTIDSLKVTINNQLNNVIPVYGNMLSSEFITERKIKFFLSKRFYILKFEKYYLKFDFTLYNSGSGWKITSFNYNEELTELLY